MSRYVLTGLSASGAVSNSTPLFMVFLAAKVTLRRVVLGVEGASSFSQGPLEAGLYINTGGGTPSVGASPLAQDSGAPVWPYANATTAWSVAPVGLPTPSVRRSVSVLSESNWVMDTDTFTNVATATVRLLVATIGNNNPTAGALSVSWTAFFDVTS